MKSKCGSFFSICFFFFLFHTLIFCFLVSLRLNTYKLMFIYGLKVGRGQEMAYIVDKHAIWN